MFLVSCILTDSFFLALSVPKRIAKICHGAPCPSHLAGSFLLYEFRGSVSGCVHIQSRVFSTKLILRLYEMAFFVWQYLLPCDSSSPSRSCTGFLTVVFEWWISTTGFTFRLSMAFQ